MLVTFPDNTTVLAHGRLGLVPSERVRPPDFAVYLDERWRDDPRVTWPYQMVTWPDFGLPSDEEGLFAIIVETHARAERGELVEIACYGGLGRTGTFLSCLAVCAGVRGEGAVEWVREHYDERAVETSEQREFVERFANSV